MRPAQGALGGPAVALGFLTRVPVGPRGHGDLAAAAWAFPLVGAAVGLAVGLVGAGAALALPVLVAAVLVVTAEVLLTGALHLDGLADCADGTGGRDREARLRIMKDHATGVYGTAAVTLDLLLKTVLVHAILVELPTAAVLVLLALAHAVSRGLLLPLAGALPSARPTGTGGYLMAGLTRGRAVTGVLSTLVVALLAPLAMWALGSAWSLPVLVLLGGALGTIAVAVWASRTLGGVTGDVLGAAAEVALLGGLLAAVAVL